MCECVMRHEECLVNALLPDTDPRRAEERSGARHPSLGHALFRESRIPVASRRRGHSSKSFQVVSGVSAPLVCTTPNMSLDPQVTPMPAHSYWRLCQQAA